MQSKSFAPQLSGYANQPAQTLLLKNSLREISGISFLPSGKLAAVNDEQGILFLIDPETGNSQALPFGKKGDYEDLAWTPEGIYVLESNGHLSLLDSQTGKSREVIKLSFPKFLEFESLCYDAPQKRLLIICKACGREEQSVIAWAFRLDSHELEPSPAFRISWQQIRTLSKDDTIEFLPSAACFHPVNGQLILLSSFAKLLVQCSPAGIPLSAHRLNPDQFQQPEGVCFAPNGDLYISNEGRQAKPNLVRFPFLTNSNTPQKN